MGIRKLAVRDVLERCPPLGDGLLGAYPGDDL